MNYIDFCNILRKSTGGDVGSINNVKIFICKFDLILNDNTTINVCGLINFEITYLDKTDNILYLCDDDLNIITPIPLSDIKRVINIKVIKPFDDLGYFFDETSRKDAINKILDRETKTENNIISKVDRFLDRKTKTENNIVNKVNWF